ncbi:ceramidase domain-containing protein [Photobacterium halotolerans]|uniref:Alkaline phytoceramidase n=1 Tax=Photobacterium halotolerans TaxID=265726 RepID=A0A0F5VGE9_9GAMM|nr:ceramidase domain-containing protein [Photobacterium halotolerans]KKD00545.1 hypothetical protein KY46_06975 [Photobacterium halotolerans]
MITGPEQRKAGLLIGSALLLILVVLYWSPIIQPANFYDYADTRPCFGVNNFINVITNLPFALVGFLGIRLLSQIPAKQAAQVIEPEISSAYFLFFQALLATSLGSAFYHLSPDPFGLMLDRIPISLAFINLYCIVLSEYLSPRLGQKLLFPLNVFGLLAVMYWYLMTTYQEGPADLSAYVLVQLLPIVHLPLILMLCKERRPGGRYYLAALVTYGFAKLAELQDTTLYTLTGMWISGHSVKHLLAALAAWWIYRLLQLRTAKR